MNASAEIDVFEAARYFSGSNENSSFSQKLPREERSYRGRKSSDMPARNILLPQKTCSMETQMKEKNSYRQPSSPGGRLANFLNSLFNHSSSKKKKKKMKSSSAMGKKEEEESPGGTKKRRSSISHFRSYITMDSKPSYSSSGSGFRTPPPYVHTPIKSLKEFTTQKQISEAPANDRTEKQKLTNVFSERDRVWSTKAPADEELIKMEVEDDGDESDSSSDLFELQIYDFHSSDLPVYESTSMERIKRGTISNTHL